MAHLLHAANLLAVGGSFFPFVIVVAASASAAVAAAAAAAAAACSWVRLPSSVACDQI